MTHTYYTTYTRAFIGYLHLSVIQLVKKVCNKHTKRNIKKTTKFSIIVLTLNIRIHHAETVEKKTKRTHFKG